MYFFVFNKVHVWNLYIGFDSWRANCLFLEKWDGVYVFIGEYWRSLEKVVALFGQSNKIIIATNICMYFYF
jgi:hypothetical protein